MASTQDAIDQTNSVLLKVEQGLARLDATNLSLKDMQERLVLLRSINESLGRLDAHLASLRKTIGSIDSMIPFIDLGGDEPLPPPAAPASRPESGEPADSAAVATAPAAESRPAESSAAAAPASPKAVAISPEERTFEIIAFSARSMTLQAADGRLTIYAKP